MTTTLLAHLPRGLSALALSAAVVACTAPTTQESPESTATAALGASCCSTAPARVTWDSANTASILSLSPGALEASTSVQQQRGSTRATLPRCSGKWYWEVTIEDYFHDGRSDAVIGVGTAAAPLSGQYIGATADSWAYFPANTEWMHNVVAGNGYAYDYGTPSKVGDVIGVALDLDAGTLTFTKNGVAQGFPFKDLPRGVPLYPMLGAADMYFGASARFSAPFAYAPPAGFAAYGGVEQTTWDPKATASILTLSDGGFTASTPVQQQRGSTRATDGKSSGKWYWEVKLDDTFHDGRSDAVIGVGDTAAPLSGAYIGATADSWGYYPWNTEWLHNVAGGHGYSYDYGTQSKVGDVIGVALDIDGGTVTFTKNGVVQGWPLTGIPHDGTTLYPMLGSADMYFGATATFSAPFAFPVPAGFSPFDAPAATCQ
jgi:hypothetical protein